MIWVLGEIVPDEALSVSVLDRTFEHGLGLFETLRTWDGRPTLLDRHLARLTRSARELEIPIDPGALPDEAAVLALRDEEGIDGDCALRITLSGGYDDGRPGTLWMRARPLPPPISRPGARVCSGWSPGEDELLMRSKALNYWSRRLAFERARRLGYDEALSRDESGAIFEGSRTNVFLVSANRLITPAARSESGRPRPILAGIMREVVVERAVALGIAVEAPPIVAIEDLRRADECFLTNAVRGIIPVAEVDASGEEPCRPIRFEPPGPLTRLLMDDLDCWLRSEDAR
ncbi:aminotransferase class IV [Tautonia sociabilis]|uniref:branched-chain-amino-acid transaminase n=1 Tax=Tautonia sociabilis TaxID=2080755 RepID=A0A432MFJ7_9BACT|nr:aminotransferase class IV [Tautonia sociabilis]RUL84980.1 branched-chain amino acid aminotransferase [Tautonia sociabilis]